MYLFTFHGKVLAFDGVNLFQTSSIDDARVLKWSPDATARVLPDEFSFSESHGGVLVSRQGKFASAIIKSDTVEVNRDWIGEWEVFLPVDRQTFDDCQLAMLSPNAERERFAKRVVELSRAGEPVTIYAGAGLVPRKGFLNLDIEMQAPGFFVKNRDDYFIFPFVCPWDIPENCVDYVFSEDFIEHIPQLLQWQFLAETFRVLKTGGWHRVNTPSIIATMKAHSDFRKGFAGVYTGEERWGHVAMLSHMQLKEMAETVGYRETVFTTKNHGVSSFAVEDCRPLADRDDVLGNIYADLLK